MTELYLYGPRFRQLFKDKTRRQVGDLAMNYGLSAELLTTYQDFCANVLELALDLLLVLADHLRRPPAAAPSVDGSLHYTCGDGGGRTGKTASNILYVRNVWCIFPK